ncbi:hypothetical protein IQ279_18670 [Streptomyces verrucosisporus]|uniref:hypothetical protein n=1 Tax=Streptomyces verrucosisporus TaxID=1695161 RepID=UPI0019D1A525|nr:hypothetical protein [Streptomyces verrucosisporus]MBN3931630.1 hypothetical protein [Streptomyces verrucosisporus]
MAETVPVRCPQCRREHLYIVPTYPCRCGAPVAPALLRGGIPVRVRHRVWADSWLTLRCSACGRYDEWPRPELGCPCGALLRPPLAESSGRLPGAVLPSAVAGGGEAPGAPSPGAAGGRPGFRPVAIRTARDVVTAAALFLGWLGFERVRPVAGAHPVPGVDLRGPDVLARVDPTTSPTGPDAVETLWLHGLNESAVAVCFSLADYTRQALGRADTLGLPLFTLDLAGTPQPVSEAAHALLGTGGPHRPPAEPA